MLPVLIVYNDLPKNSGNVSSRYTFGAPEEIDHMAGCEHVPQTIDIYPGDYVSAGANAPKYPVVIHMNAIDHTDNEQWTIQATKDSINCERLVGVACQRTVVKDKNNNVLRWEWHIVKLSG